MFCNLSMHILINAMIFLERTVEQVTLISDVPLSFKVLGQGFQQSRDLWDLLPANSLLFDTFPRLELF